MLVALCRCTTVFHLLCGTSLQKETWCPLPQSHLSPKHIVISEMFTREICASSKQCDVASSSLSEGACEGDCVFLIVQIK